MVLRTRWQWIVIIVSLLLLPVAPVTAEPPAARPTDDAFTKPVEALTYDDFWRMAEMIIEEGTATTDEADVLLERLTTKQFAEFQAALADYMSEHGLIDGPPNIAPDKPGAAPLTPVIPD